jgi:hypothetical protein
MASEGDFNPSPEYWASLIVAILRRFKRNDITLTLQDMKETAPLGMHIVTSSDGSSLTIEVINSEGKTPVEDYVGLDFSSNTLPDPTRLN